ncbi:hypothetical protein JHW43_004757 [Diplocarpon mali]|nr:hypothetical protein JHW43_004757 [Diplocarpon mali]
MFGAQYLSTRPALRGIPGCVQLGNSRFSRGLLRMASADVSDLRGAECQEILMRCRARRCDVLSEPTRGYADSTSKQAKPGNQEIKGVRDACGSKPLDELPKSTLGCCWPWGDKETKLLSSRSPVWRLSVYGAKSWQQLPRSTALHGPPSLLYQYTVDARDRVSPKPRYVRLGKLSLRVLRVLLLVRQKYEYLAMRDISFSSRGLGTSLSGLSPRTSRLIDDGIRSPQSAVRCPLSAV